MDVLQTFVKCNCIHLNSEKSNLEHLNNVTFLIRAVINSDGKVGNQYKKFHCVAAGFYAKSSPPSQNWAAGAVCRYSKDRFVGKVILKLQWIQFDLSRDISGRFAKSLREADLKRNSSTLTLRACHSEFRAYVGSNLCMKWIWKCSDVERKRQGYK